MYSTIGNFNYILFIRKKRSTVWIPERITCINLNDFLNSTFMFSFILNIKLRYFRAMGFIYGQMPFCAVFSPFVQDALSKGHTCQKSYYTYCAMCKSHFLQGASQSAQLRLRQKEYRPAVEHQSLW